MSVIELARLVKQARDAQRSYFAARRNGLQATAELEASKRLEKQLDETVKVILCDHPALLPGME